MKKIRSVYFDKHDLERIEEVAKKRRTTVSAVIREVMADFLREDHMEGKWADQEKR